MASTSMAARRLDAPPPALRRRRSGGGRRCGGSHPRRQPLPPPAAAEGLLPPLPRRARGPTGLGRAAVAGILSDAAWPPAFPYDAADWRRFDETPDGDFYARPRFVFHLDDAAVAAQAAYYARLTAARGADARLPDVLDVCSSWVSFLPAAYTAAAAAGGVAGGGPRVAGVGLNERELGANPQLTDHVVLDLNGGATVPRLPYPDATFDVAVCSVSVDYLTRPREVAAEVARVLRPGGLFACTFSNRSFGTKAVAAWSGGGDADHIYLVGAVLHYAGGGGLFDAPAAIDLSPPGGGDPLYAVQARRV
ncbi:hypothetical protein BU14_0728s0003 [Porphyra umbilicalis]|uniref:Methyltransferase type 11 domain-containing protein n=1 Tax=Porphyra umbilicalis TaxID=2786 RepID=A0A1X6NPL8_PORUM|nr:hypothetical protein BU14_0728s0003 [Porphyra umbilicalis]|eukprot:OSX70537.1 hypothetical protein BU14_0728s0003 [Porphyra umbilicalis]